MAAKIIFMGTPDFGVPILTELVDHFQIISVVTQPDRPSGRGRKMQFSPIKSTARELGLSVFQPDSLSQSQAFQFIKELDPELVVVAAYGEILPVNILSLPPHGCLNVHASLLPRWRGASPIHAAILHGDEKSGVTIMKMDQGLDTGPILAKREIPISAKETAGSLFSKLSHLGAQLLVETIPPYLAGEIHLRPQDDSKAIYAPLLTRKDGNLDFSNRAEYLARQVRAFHPWPGCFFFWQKQRLIVHQAHAENVTSPGEGVLVTHEAYPAIGTSQGILVLDEIQPAGKQNMPGDSFLRGAREWGPTSRN